MGVQNKAGGRPPWESDLAAKTRKKEVNELGTWERDQPQKCPMAGVSLTC